MSLTWNGKGFLHNVPSRDLTDEEVKEFGGEQFLLASGLYEKDAPVKVRKERNKPTTDGEKWQE